MTTDPDLSKQIEDPVRQHADTLRASAAAAVARAFAAVPTPLSARASTQSKPVRGAEAGSAEASAGGAKPNRTACGSQEPRDVIRDQLGLRLEGRQRRAQG
jgi:hypothetical protein